MMSYDDKDAVLPGFSYDRLINALEMIRLCEYFGTSANDECWPADVQEEVADCMDRDVQTHLVVSSNFRTSATSVADQVVNE